VRVLTFTTTEGCSDIADYCYIVALDERRLGVLVADEAGVGVEGAEVRLRVSEGGATLQALTLRTGPDGTAETTLVVADSGTTVVAGETDGAPEATYRLYAFPPLRVRLPLDTVEVEVGCVRLVQAELSGGGRQNFIGEQVDFATVDSTRAFAWPVWGSGSFSGQRTDVTGRRPGTTWLVARYDGAVDSAVVRVIPASDLRVDLEGTAHPSGRIPATLSLGETVRVAGSARNLGCGHFPDTIPVEIRSSDPAVVRVDAGGILVAVAPGTATIAAVAQDQRAEHVIVVR
jgi:hypothetical protein